MVAFGRLLGAFGFMMVIGYIAVVALLPAPDTSIAQASEPSSARTAARLAQEARSLSARKPASSIQ